MTDLPFNKDVILSQPIECENDLADVIVELRKAVGHLLQENEDLRHRCDALDAEMVRLEQPQNIPWDSASTRGIRPPPFIPTGWTPTTTAMTATEVAERMDAMISPSLIKTTTEYVD